MCPVISFSACVQTELHIQNDCFDVRIDVHCIEFHRVVSVQVIMFSILKSIENIMYRVPELAFTCEDELHIMNTKWLVFFYDLWTERTSDFILKWC